MDIFFINFNSRKGGIKLVQVNIISGNIEQAFRNLKRKLQREGVFRAVKLKRHYEKPSEKKQRKEEEAYRRRRKFDRRKPE